MEESSPLVRPEGMNTNMHLHQELVRQHQATLLREGKTERLARSIATPSDGAQSRRQLSWVRRLALRPAYRGV